MFELEKRYNGFVVKEPGSIVSIYVQNYNRNHEYIFTTDHLYAKVYTEGTAICHMNALNALENSRQKGE